MEDLHRVVLLPVYNNELVLLGNNPSEGRHRGLYGLPGGEYNRRVDNKAIVEAIEAVRLRIGLESVFGGYIGSLETQLSRNGTQTHIHLVGVNGSSCIPSELDFESSNMSPLPTIVSDSMFLCNARLEGIHGLLRNVRENRYGIQLTPITHQLLFSLAGNIISFISRQN
ncbi:MAG: hypothetical protein WCO33_00070 [bacterium]